MGALIVLPTRAPADGWVLAPERYDPGRRVAADNSVLLEDLFEVATENVSPKSDMACSSLVLDTTHAQEGFVLYRHAPAPTNTIGSFTSRWRYGHLRCSIASPKRHAPSRAPSPKVRSRDCCSESRVNAEVVGSPCRAA